MPTLTPRESDILRALVEGKTSKMIATDLHLSPETVREYIARIYRKLDVHNRAQCIVQALQRRLI